MNLTTNQITSIARSRILETTSEVISDTIILLYANLTQQDIFKKAFPNSQILSATITFSNGVGTLPTYFGTLYGDAFKSIGDVYPELSIDDFQKQTLPKGVTIEGGTIKVIPTTVTSLNIKYYPTFPDISSSVNPTIDGYFHELIIDGIVYRAMFDLQDFELATAYRAKYDKDLAEKISIQSQYEEGNQRAGQMFNEQALVTDGSLLGGGPNFF